MDTETDWLDWHVEMESRREFLGWLFVLPTLMAMNGDPDVSFESTQDAAVYIVNGWVLTGKDLEALGIDAA